MTKFISLGTHIKEQLGKPWFSIETGKPCFFQKFKF